MAIGRKHGASAAQVALKWLLDQDGVAAIPKASRAESQKANLDALNVGLDDEDMQGDRRPAERQALCESRLCAGVGLSRFQRDGLQSDKAGLSRVVNEPRVDVGRGLA